MNFDKMCMIPGYAYVPIQKLNSVYDSDKALERGTIFPCLDIPMNEYGKQDMTECDTLLYKEETEKC